MRREPLRSSHPAGMAKKMMVISILYLLVSAWNVAAFSANSDDRNMFELLQARIEQANKFPLVFRETLLPRQKLGITIKNGMILDLIRRRMQDETPTFGMLGVQQSGDPMTHGVEVEILSYGMNKWKTGIRVELKAGRRFRLVDHLEESVGGWYQAPIQFLESEEQEEEELHNSLSTARQLASQFTDPDNHLVNKWLKLARMQERFVGQIDSLLEDLGEIPDAPSERAFWIGALINPSPKIHLAFEIRQRLLKAKRAEERVQISLDAIQFSIRRMESARGIRQSTV